MTDARKNNASSTNATDAYDVPVAATINGQKIAAKPLALFWSGIKYIYISHAATSQRP